MRNAGCSCAAALDTNRGRIRQIDGCQEIDTCEPSCAHLESQTLASLGAGKLRVPKDELHESLMHLVWPGTEVIRRQCLTPRRGVGELYLDNFLVFGIIMTTFRGKLQSQASGEVFNNGQRDGRRSAVVAKCLDTRLALFAQGDR